MMVSSTAQPLNLARIKGPGLPPNGLVCAPADEVNTAQIVKGAKYDIELFYGTNTGTANRTVSKVLLSDMVPATAGVTLPWYRLGTQSRKAFDPSDSLAGLQTSLTLDWEPNIAAQQINGVQAINNTGSYGNTTPVRRGETSVVFLSGNPTNVPAFSSSTGSRNVLFSYRMLDGSSKTAVYRYN